MSGQPFVEFRDLLAQVLLLSGHTHWAVVRMADTSHHATLSDHRDRSEAVLLGPQQRSDHHHDYSEMSESNPWNVDLEHDDDETSNPWIGDLEDDQDETVTCIDSSSYCLELDLSEPRPQHELRSSTSSEDRFRASQGSNGDKAPQLIPRREPSNRQLEVHDKPPRPRRRELSNSQLDFDEDTSESTTGSDPTMQKQHETHIRRCNPAVITAVEPEDGYLLRALERNNSFTARGA